MTTYYPTKAKAQETADRLNETSDTITYRVTANYHTFRFFVEMFDSGGYSMGSHYDPSVELGTYEAAR